jgi:hypothetical protein
MIIQRRAGCIVHDFDLAHIALISQLINSELEVSTRWKGNIFHNGSTKLPVWLLHSLIIRKLMNIGRWLML